MYIIVILIVLTWTIIELYIVNVVWEHKDVV